MNSDYEVQIEPSCLTEENSKKLELLLLADLHKQGVVDDNLFEMAGNMILGISSPPKGYTEPLTDDETEDESFSAWYREIRTGKVVCFRCGYEPPVNEYGRYITSEHCPGCGVRMRKVNGRSIF